MAITQHQARMELIVKEIVIIVKVEKIEKADRPSGSTARTPGRLRPADENYRRRYDEIFPKGSVKPSSN